MGLGPIINRPGSTGFILPGRRVGESVRVVPISEEIGQPDGVGIDRPIPQAFALWDFSDAGSGTSVTVAHDRMTNPVNVTVTPGTGSSWMTDSIGKGYTFAGDTTSMMDSGVLTGTKFSTALALAVRLTVVLRFQRGGSDLTVPVFAISDSADTSKCEWYADGRNFWGDQEGATQNSNPDYDTSMATWSFVWDLTQLVAADRLLIYKGQRLIARAGTGLSLNQPIENGAAWSTLHVYFGRNPGVATAFNGTLKFAGIWLGALVSGDIQRIAAIVDANDDVDPTLQFALPADTYTPFAPPKRFAPITDIFPTLLGAAASPAMAAEQYHRRMRMASMPDPVALPPLVAFGLVLDSPPSPVIKLPNRVRADEGPEPSITSTLRPFVESDSIPYARPPRVLPDMPEAEITTTLRAFVESPGTILPRPPGRPRGDEGHNPTITTTLRQFVDAPGTLPPKPPGRPKGDEGHNPTIPTTLRDFVDIEFPQSRPPPKVFTDPSGLAVSSATTPTQPILDQLPPSVPSRLRTQLDAKEAETTTTLRPFVDVPGTILPRPPGRPKGDEANNPAITSTLRPFVESPGTVLPRPPGRPRGEDGPEPSITSTLRQFVESPGTILPRPPGRPRGEDGPEPSITSTLRPFVDVPGTIPPKPPGRPRGDDAREPAITSTLRPFVDVPGTILPRLVGRPKGDEANNPTIPTTLRPFVDVPGTLPPKPPGRPRGEDGPEPSITSTLRPFVQSDPPQFPARRQRPPDTDPVEIPSTLRSLIDQPYLVVPKPKGRPVADEGALVSISSTLRAFVDVPGTFPQRPPGRPRGEDGPNPTITSTLRAFVDAPYIVSPALRKVIPDMPHAEVTTTLRAFIDVYQPPLGKRVAPTADGSAFRTTSVVVYGLLDLGQPPRPAFRKEPRLEPAVLTALRTFGPLPVSEPAGPRPPRRYLGPDVAVAPALVFPVVLDVPAPLRRGWGVPVHADAGILPAAALRVLVDAPLGRAPVVVRRVPVAGGVLLPTSSTPIGWVSVDVVPSTVPTGHLAGPWTLVGDIFETVVPPVSTHAARQFRMRVTFTVKMWRPATRTRLT